MRRLAIAAPSVLALALVTGRSGVAAAPPAPAPAPAPAPLTVVVAARARTADGLAAKTQLRLVTVGKDVQSSRFPSGGGTLTHPPEAIVKGDLLVDASGHLKGVAIVADERSGSPPYGAALSYVEASGTTRRLATGVSLASRPLVGAGAGGAADEIYIERGVVGGASNAASVRVDSLEIDAVDPSTGSLRVVMTWQGYITHIAGVIGPELVVYRVGPSAAELVLVDRATGKTRGLTTLAPFARDFSIDANRNAIVLSNRDAADDSRWVVERYDLKSGARTELGSSRGDAVTPFSLGDGSVWWTAPLRAGLISDRAPSRVRTPLGAGYTYITSASADGSWFAITNVPNEGRFDGVALYRPQSERVVVLGSSTERVDVIGIVGAQSGGLR